MCSGDQARNLIRPDNVAYQIYKKIAPLAHSLGRLFIGSEPRRSATWLWRWVTPLEYGLEDVTWTSAATQPSHSLKWRSAASDSLFAKQQRAKFCTGSGVWFGSQSHSRGFQEGLSVCRPACGRSPKGLAAGPGQPQISVVICCGFA